MVVAGAAAGAGVASGDGCVVQADSTRTKVATPAILFIERTVCESALRTEDLNPACAIQGEARITATCAVTDHGPGLGSPWVTPHAVIT